MTTFDQAHRGDKVRICLPGGITQPLRLLVDPVRCSDSCCLALHSRGVDSTGWIEQVRAYADTEINVIEQGPWSSAEDAMSAHLAQRAGDPEEAAWTPWTGRDHPEDRDDQADYEPSESEE